MTEPIRPTDTDPRALGRRRRAKRALVANYLNQLSARQTERRAARRRELSGQSPIEQPQGG